MSLMDLNIAHHAFVKSANDFITMAEAGIRPSFGKAFAVRSWGSVLIATQKAENVVLIAEEKINERIDMAERFC